MEHQLVGNTLVVRLQGELDLVVAAQFKQGVDDILDRRPVRYLVVNLERVTFVDSAFLGALLGRYRRLRAAGGRMAIAGTPGSVKPTLELSGIFRTMEAYGSESEAITAGA